MNVSVLSFQVSLLVSLILSVSFQDMRGKEGGKVQRERERERERERMQEKKKRWQCEVWTKKRRFKTAEGGGEPK